MPVRAGGLNKMKKIYRKEEGVSPVIATILMVAITVVLAATVYIMVSGYMGGTTAKQAPKLNGSITVSKDGTWVNFTVQGNPAQQVKFSAIKKILIDDTISITTIRDTTTPGAGTAGYNDINGDGLITDGDIIIIHLSNALSSGSHTLKLVHANGVMFTGSFVV